MRLVTRAQHRWLFSTLLILSIVSFAVPHASQDDASDEFILFASDRAFPSEAGICASCEDIYVMPPAGELPGVPNGTDVVRLTAAPGTDVNPAWSPKGDKIAFESNRTGRPEIWVMNADGSEQVRLTNFDADITPSNVNVTKATWSPKGDRIAFHRRVTPVAGMQGHLEVYTMNADGTGVPTRITFSADPGFSGFPSWGKWGTE